jgi:hypothetical protein
MTASMIWSERDLVIESETVRREAVGCIAWLDLKRPTRLLDMDSMFISNEIQSRPLGCFGVI